MLRLNEIRRIADRNGARDISKVEIDVVLTYLLQLFSEGSVTKSCWCYDQAPHQERYTVRSR